MRNNFGIISNSVLAVAMLTSCEQICDKQLLICGTYTEMRGVQTGSHGVYSLAFDAKTGMLSVIDSAQAYNPSYVAISNEHDLIYAVKETGKDAGVYTIPCNKNTGKFDVAEFCEGTSADPCYVALFNGKLLTADYSGGAVSVFGMNDNGKVNKRLTCVNLADNSISTDHEEVSHAHTVNPINNESALVITDLGTHRVYFAVKSQTNNSGFAITDTVQLEKGFGPRHIDVTPNGKYCYILGELSGLIQSLCLDGKNIKKGGSAVCDTVGAHGSADIHISPDGKFLYASNRLKDDGIRVFAIEENGNLTNLQYVLTGRHPRNFALSPDGNYILVACRDDNRIEVYRRSKSTGIITPERVSELQVPAPVCLKFMK